MAQEPLEEGEKTGRFDDGYAYESRVSEYEIEGLEQTAGEGFQAAGPAPQTYLVEVFVSMPRQKRVLHLQTIRTIFPESR